MSKERRLRKSSEFTNIFRGGKTWVHSLMVLRAVPNGLESSRYGFIVSKKVGNAVVRNRVRRRMREVARLTPVKRGWDLVFIARNGVATVRYQDIEVVMRGLLKQARLLPEEQG